MNRVRDRFDLLHSLVYLQSVEHLSVAHCTIFGSQSIEMSILKVDEIDIGKETLLALPDYFVPSHPNRHTIEPSSWQEGTARDCKKLSLSWDEKFVERSARDYHRVG